MATASLRASAMRGSQPSTTFSSTCVPAAHSLGLVDSAGLWDSPSLQGRKIIVLGATAAAWAASWPAPETMSRIECSVVAPALTEAMHPASNTTGAVCKPDRCGGVLHQRLDLGLHPLQHRVQGVGQVDGRPYLAGDDVVRILANNATSPRPIPGRWAQPWTCAC